ncbi:hypothetical protein ACFORO_42565 [Amycolatopsis halotolerans]|uniref:DUF1653 domain-containing protein n=2 Tax=Amycolatopsis halotolerans TaxID=330083 RepID=A0ABV7QXI7_9PSEU
MMVRRTATPADIWVGAHVFKGNGKTLYRVWAVRGDHAGVVKATTRKDPTRGTFYPIDTYTVEEGEFFDPEFGAKNETEWLADRLCLVAFNARDKPGRFSGSGAVAALLRRLAEVPNLTPELLRAMAERAELEDRISGC